MPQPQSLPKPSDRWRPWYFVIFFLSRGLVLVPMCIIAVRTNTGVVTDGAYEKGLAYNKAIEAEKRQQLLHWQGKLDVGQPVNGSVHMDVALQDADGKPIRDAEVKLWLVRPTQAGKDQNTKLTLDQKNHYSGDISLPEIGMWETRVSATSEGRNYQFVKRVQFP